MTDDLKLQAGRYKVCKLRPVLDKIIVNLRLVSTLQYPAIRYVHFFYWE